MAVFAAFAARSAGSRSCFWVGGGSVSEGRELFVDKGAFGKQEVNRLRAQLFSLFSGGHLFSFARSGQGV